MIQEESKMDEQKVIESFHMMWDNFPEPVMLIKKSRQIYAVNKKAASLGLSEASPCTRGSRYPCAGPPWLPRC